MGHVVALAGRGREERTYDAIVVGSGISGGWAAKELTEAGLRTLVLERGRNVEHVKDYPTAMKAPWELPHGNKPTQQDLADYPVQKDLYLFGQDSKHFLVKDVDHPYNAVQEFRWFRGYQVGGRSLLWARHCFRWSDLDFEANLKEGVGIDWPIRYADIAPWYDKVEEFIGVSGENAGLPQLPDGRLLPPFEMNCIEEHVRKRLPERFPDRRLIASRQAVLSRPHNGRGQCQSRNLCHRGCPFGAYFSSNSSTLPAAAATGRLTLRPFSIAHSVICDEGTGRAAGVRVVDAETKETTEYFARVVFLNASALNTTALMLNSRCRHHPNGFGNSSGVLGHYLMDHHAGLGAFGSYDGYADRYYAGRRSTSVYIPRFRNVGARHPDFARGYAYEMYTGREGWSSRAGQPGVGASFKDQLTKPGRWTVWMEGYGECLPRHENKVTLSPDRRDQWGLPVLDIDMTYGPNEHAMRKDIEAQAGEMLRACDLQGVETFHNPPHPGEVIHEMGTARMGADPKQSVLDRFNRCHDAPNVYVTDGACMASTACQNPSLTYMALTARACAHAVSALKRGDA
jgi:glucoside 3-dehydrogenase (cytochrome c) catalytic subunit